MHHFAKYKIVKVYKLDIYAFITVQIKVSSLLYKSNKGPAILHSGFKYISQKHKESQSYKLYQNRHNYSQCNKDKHTIDLYRMKLLNIFYYIVKIILYKEIFFLQEFEKLVMIYQSMSLLYYLAMKFSTTKKIQKFYYKFKNSFKRQVVSQ